MVQDENFLSSSESGLIFLIDMHFLEWSTSPGSHSFEVHSCEQFRRMVRFGGWCRIFISIRKWSGLSFPREESFSLGCTMISSRGMAQLGEWSRFNNQG
jgi:hypothetical protein